MQKNVIKSKTWEEEKQKHKWHETLFTSYFVSNEYGVTTNRSKGSLQCDHSNTWGQGSESQISRDIFSLLFRLQRHKDFVAKTVQSNRSSR